MKKLLLLLTIVSPFLNINKLLAGPGDTLTTIRSHNNVHMNWFGYFDRWAQFPASTSGPFYRVFLEYTLGCPTTGCSEWDYTTQVFLKHNTGQSDSTLQQAPRFTINNQTPDSLGIAINPVFTTSWNNTTQQTDTLWSNPISIFLYLNQNNPLLITDTIVAYPAWFWYYEFNSFGQISDSTFVQSDSTLYQQFTPYFNVFPIIENYEIARVITPYAGTFNNNWKWTYKFDITDFQHLLKDSVQISALYSGYQDGFTITLDFIFIEGTPAWPVIQMKKMFGGSFPYGNPANPIGNLMTPILHAKAPGTSRTETKLNITGHGFGGNENCAEFCPKNYLLLINGQQKESQLVWNNQCGWNPIFPQGGTWVYDRSNWCPGSAVKSFTTNITPWIGNNPAEIRFNMQNFTNINNNYCSYIAEAYLTDFASPSYPIEASLEEIIAPTNNPNHSRFNPICGNPEIKVKNEGENPIQSLLISYGINGATPSSHLWTGLINPREEKTIILPTPTNWTAPSQNPTLQFFAEIIQVNNQTDALGFNNKKTSDFTPPPVLPDSFLIYFKTNNRPQENRWTIEDQNGNIIQQRNTFPANQVTRDTLRLNPGCYRFKFYDNAGDGITFWANSAAGSGSLRLQEITSSGIQIIRNFPGDFGSGVDFSFTVGYKLPLETNNEKTWAIFPNPSNGNFSINAPNPISGNLQIKILDLSGRVLESSNLNSSNQSQFSFSTNNLAAGTYLIQLSINHQIEFSNSIIILPN